MKKYEIIKYLNLIEYKRIKIVDTLEEARKIIDKSQNNEEIVIYELEYFDSDIIEEYTLDHIQFNRKYEIVEKENYITYVNQNEKEILKICYVE